MEVDVDIQTDICGDINLDVRVDVEGNIYNVIRDVRDNNPVMDEDVFVDVIVDNSGIHVDI